MPGIGRNAKSTQLHILQGTFRKDRHGHYQTPAPPQGPPQPPKRLSREEQGEWDRMIVRLTHTTSLSLVDDGALLQYVQLFAETATIGRDATATRFLVGQLKRALPRLKRGEVIRAVEQIGQLQQLLARRSVQLRQGHMALMRCLIEFGLTPASRSRVKLPKEPAEPDARETRFFAGRPSSA